MDNREVFVQELHAQPLGNADIIFLAAGDDLSRVPYVAELFRAGRAPFIVMVSADRRHEYGSTPAGELAERLIELGVPEQALIVQENALNTKEESTNVVRLMKTKGWNSALLVTSPHHQYRLFLTFLKTMRDEGLALVLINAPAPLSLTEETPYGRREDLLPQEFERVTAYQQKGDLASYAEGLEYLQNKEAHT